MNIYKNLGRNTLVFTIGNIGSSLITFLMLPVFTNYLSTSEYGTIDIITITLNLIMPFFTLNIADSILRYAMDKEYDNTKVFTTSLYIFLTLSCITLPIAFIISRFISIPINSFLILAIVFSMFLYPILQQFTRAIGKTKIFVTADIMFTLIFSIANIILVVKYSMGISGYFISLVIGKTIAILFLIITARLYKYVKVRSYDSGYANEFIKYSLPLMPNSISWWIVNLSDRFMLQFFCGTSITGIYSVANKIPTVLSTLYNIFFKAWQMSSYETYGSEDSKQFYENVFKYLNIFMTVMSMGIIIFIDLIVKIFIGKNFYDAIYYIPILIIAFVYSSYSSFIGTIYTASKNTRGILKSTIMSAAINIVINVIFIPIFGELIAAWSTAISYIILFVFRVKDTRRFMEIKLNYRKLVVTTSMLLLQAICVIVCNNIVIKLLVNSFIFIVYLILERKEIVKLIIETKKVIKLKKSR